MKDLADAIQLDSWLPDAKAKAREEGQCVYLVRKSGGFDIAMAKPSGVMQYAAKVYPGGRVEMGLA